MALQSSSALFPNPKSQNSDKYAFTCNRFFNSYPFSSNRFHGLLNRMEIRGVNNGSTGESSTGGIGGKKKVVLNSNYVVPLDATVSSAYESCFTRPLMEILRDLNKKVPDNIVKRDDSSSADSSFIPWFHANRLLSFYAPGWCGEIRDVIFSDNGTVTVVYRLIIRGSDGEAYRESTGTVSTDESVVGDSVAVAEKIAFCKACARFGLGLYLYHEEPSV